jgi:hypothetical protein
MTPRTLLRTAALNALAAAAGLDPGDPDFAPLIGLQIFLGQAWPSQSPAPGVGPMPSQALVYIWNEKSETVAEKTTAPQFETTAMLVIEARVETRAPAASATLPATPDAGAVANAIDGALELLTFALKKAICQGIGVAARALNGGRPMIETIKAVEIADKISGAGQRIAGNGVMTVDLLFGEIFEPLLTTSLTDLVVLIGATAGGVANGGNTGNGTISAVTVGLGAQPGGYAVLFSSATAYAVTAPDSTPAGTGVVGTQFTGGGLTWTIAAGGTAFVAGDGFAVTVQAAAETQLDLSLTYPIWDWSKWDEGTWD